MGTTVYISMKGSSFTKDIGSKNEAGLYLRLIRNTFNWESPTIKESIKVTKYRDYKISQLGIASILWVLDRYILGDLDNLKYMDDAPKEIFINIREEYTSEEIDTCRETLIQILTHMLICNVKRVRFDLL